MQTVEYPFKDDYINNVLEVGEFPDQPTDPAAGVLQAVGGWGATLRLPGWSGVGHADEGNDWNKIDVMLSFSTLKTNPKEQSDDLKGILWDVGHRTSFPSDPVCCLSLQIVFNTFHSVLLVAEIVGARLV